MTSQIEELKQYALMYANEIKRTNPNNHKFVKEAYRHAKQLQSLVCPICWVKSIQEVPLEIEAYATDVNIYRCEICSFSCVLPK